MALIIGTIYLLILAGIFLWVMKHSSSITSGVISEHPHPCHFLMGAWLTVGGIALMALMIGKENFLGAVIIGFFVYMWVRMSYASYKRWRNNEFGSNIHSDY